MTKSNRVMDTTKTIVTFCGASVCSPFPHWPFMTRTERAKYISASCNPTNSVNTLTKLTQ